MRGLVRLAGVAALGAVLLFASGALAQNAANTATTKDVPVEARGVGISGGIIAGAEIVLILEAVIDVEPVWAWWVFPILGAGGGGVGGYYLEKASPGGAVGLLVGAMALMIPTAVAVSISRAYDPEDEAGEARPAGGEGTYSFEMAPKAGADEGGGTYTEVQSRPEDIPEGTGAVPPEEFEPAPETEPEPAAPEGGTDGSDDGGGEASHLMSGSLFHVGRDMSAGFGIPAVDVRPTALSGEETMLGMRQGIEISVPLLKIDLP